MKNLVVLNEFIRQTPGSKRNYNGSTGVRMIAAGISSGQQRHAIRTIFLTSYPVRFTNYIPRSQYMLQRFPMKDVLVATHVNWKSGIASHMKLNLH